MATSGGRWTVSTTIIRRRSFHPTSAGVDIVRKPSSVEPVSLNAPQRESVETAVRKTCTLRNWHMCAINVRTNHVHVVVAIGTARPEHALNAFKANATKQLRQDGHWPQQQTPWADKGSKRYLWNERSIERAIDYVINGQGDNLPEFDSGDRCR